MSEMETTRKRTSILDGEGSNTKPPTASHSATDAEKSDWRRRDDEFTEATKAGKEMRTRREKEDWPLDHPDYAHTAAEKNTISGGTRTKVATAASAAADAQMVDWRRRDDEFIGATKAGKEMRARRAKGGRVSDQPPYPPSEHPDYEQTGAEPWRSGIPQDY